MQVQCIRVLDAVGDRVGGRGGGRERRGLAGEPSVRPSVGLLVRKPPRPGRVLRAAGAAGAAGQPESVRAGGVADPRAAQGDQVRGGATPRGALHRERLQTALQHLQRDGRHVGAGSGGRPRRPPAAVDRLHRAERLAGRHHLRPADPQAARPPHDSQQAGRPRRLDGGGQRLLRPHLRQRPPQTQLRTLLGRHQPCGRLCQP
jgi:hypothetical protein